MYADDTTLYFNLEDFNEQDKESAINNELQKIHDWLQRNKLTLNVAKTKFMTFHKSREVPDLKLSLNNKDIDKVNTFSFLGILVDSDLCWFCFEEWNLAPLHKIIHHSIYLWQIIN